MCKSGSKVTNWKPSFGALQTCAWSSKAPKKEKGNRWQPKRRVVGDIIKCTVIENYKPATKNVKRNGGGGSKGGGKTAKTIAHWKKRVVGKGKRKGGRGSAFTVIIMSTQLQLALPPISLFLAQQHNAFCLRNVCGERGGDENRNGNKEFTL